MDAALLLWLSTVWSIEMLPFFCKITQAQEYFFKRQIRRNIFHNLLSNMIDNLLVQYWCTGTQQQYIFIVVPVLLYRYRYLYIVQYVVML